MHSNSTENNNAGGENVEVIINRRNNDQVQLKLVSERYRLVFVSGILGLVSGAIGFIGIFYRSPSVT